MRRVGAPDECTGAFLYLCSDKLCGYVTGQVIEVNGGLLMPWRRHSESARGPEACCGSRGRGV